MRAVCKRMDLKRARLLLGKTQPTLDRNTVKRLWKKASKLYACQFVIKSQRHEWGMHASIGLPRVPLCEDGCLAMLAAMTAHTQSAHPRRCEASANKPRAAIIYSPHIKAYWVRAVEAADKILSNSLSSADQNRRGRKGGILKGAVSLALLSHGVKTTQVVKQGRDRRILTHNWYFDRLMDSISKWTNSSKIRSRLKKNALRSTRKKLQSTSGSKVHFKKMELELSRLIRWERDHKHRVTLEQLSNWAIKLLVDGTVLDTVPGGHKRSQWRPDDTDTTFKSFKASRGWRAAFMHRYGFSLRKKTNSKSKSVVERMPMMINWSRRLRHFLFDQNQHGSDLAPEMRRTKFGAFSLDRRFNVRCYPAY